MARNNKYTIKVWKWDWDGEFGAVEAPYNFNTAKAKRDLISVWNDAEFEGFEMKINGGVGECVFQLGRKFDDYGEGEDVKLFNMVEIISHAHGGAGKPIYRGYISKYRPWADGSEEGVEVTCLGYQTALQVQSYHLNYFPADFAQYYAISEYLKFTISANPASIIKYMVDGHNFGDASNYGKGSPDGEVKLEKVDTFTPINYTSESIQDSDNTITAEFSYPTKLEVLNWCVRVSDNIDYWYMDGRATINFKEFNKQEDHTFTFKKDFTAIDLENSMEDTFNKIVVSNRRQWNDKDRFALHYPTDLKTRLHTSLADGQMEEGYLREELVEDYSITSDSEMRSKIGNRYEAVREPKKSLEFRISARDYDIDTIEPGHTCRVLGMPKTIEGLDLNNLTINAVIYMKDYVRLELVTPKEQLRSQITKDKPNQNIKVVGREDIPKNLEYDLTF